MNISRHESEQVFSFDCLPATEMVQHQSVYKFVANQSVSFIASEVNLQSVAERLGGGS